MQSFLYLLNICVIIAQGERSAVLYANLKRYKFARFDKQYHCYFVCVYGFGGAADNQDRAFLL